MKELFIKQAEIFENYNILISYFSYKEKDIIKYRIYFKDLNRNYLFNPIKIEKDNEGKTIKYYHEGNFYDLEIALHWIIKNIEEYLKEHE